MTTKTYDVTVRFTLTDDDPDDTDYPNWKPTEDVIKHLIHTTNDFPLSIDFEEVLEIKENEE